jgi:hypothetical protein
MLVRNCGSIWQFFPLSQKASDWIDEHVETESWQWMGNSLVVDWRFGGPLLDGARAAGLKVKERL